MFILWHLLEGIWHGTFIKYYPAHPILSPCHSRSVSFMFMVNICRRNDSPAQVFHALYSLGLFMAYFRNSFPFFGGQNRRGGKERARGKKHGQKDSRTRFASHPPKRTRSQWPKPQTERNPPIIINCTLKDKSCV